MRDSHQQCDWQKHETPNWTTVAWQVCLQPPYVSGDLNSLRFLYQKFVHNSVSSRTLCPHIFYFIFCLHCEQIWPLCKKNHLVSKQEEKFQILYCQVQPAVCGRGYVAAKTISSQMSCQKTGQDSAIISILSKGWSFIAKWSSAWASSQGRIQQTTLL